MTGQKRTILANKELLLDGCDSCLLYDDTPYPMEQGCRRKHESIMQIRYLPVNKLEWSIIQKSLRLAGLKHGMSWDELLTDEEVKERLK